MNTAKIFEDFAKRLSGIRESFINESTHDNRLLFEDCVGYAVWDLNESTNGTTKFRGKLQEANTVNKNKRMYPFEILNQNVEKLMEVVKVRGLYGELDHPTDSIVHLANTSHIITKLWWEGNILMGEGEILNTPNGKVLKALIDAGTRIGMSSRGVGNGQVNNEGVLVIGESFKLITFDAVADPSTFEAFQEKVKTTKKESVLKISPAKNEGSRIDTINANAFISYFGHIVQKNTCELKERLS